MAWNHQSGRSGRVDRRPDLESLEARQLLSLADPAPAASSASFVRADGTVNNDAVIEASTARASYGVDGAGSNVAVIDTGVNYNNPAFGSGAVGSATNKVVAGVDFTGSPNGVLPTWQHGTGVAGLIASTDSTNPGVAPGAGIVALRVFGDDNTGSFDNIARALDWVIQNHDKYHITAVNLSVSDGGNYTSNLFGADGSAGQAITSAVATLDGENIPVVVAAGNKFDGKTQGEGFASIIPDTISVTATDETRMTGAGGDPLASDAQRLGVGKGGASATDIAAPGVDVVAPSGGSGTAVEEGTSFATPQVTGTVVLLQQMYQRAYGTLPSVAQLDGWLKAGAVTIHDGVTGIDIGRLDVAGSLRVLAGQIQATAASPKVVAAETLQPPTAPTTTPAPAPTTPAAVATAPAVLTTTPTTAPTTITTPTPTPTPTPVAPPTAPVADVTMTEVIVNGSSIGSVPTQQLATAYARLFALTHGTARNLRAWVPAGSTLDIGAVRPSGSAVVVTSPGRRGPNRSAAAARVDPGLGLVQATHPRGVGTQHGKHAPRSA